MALSRRTWKELIGIDIDGTEGVRRLEQIIGIIPETLAFTTPGGQDRRRLLFLHPSIEVANRSLRVDGHEAVRIMTKGTQTVMPPSRHASGGRYSWTNQSAPLPFPQLLLDYLLLPEAPSVIAPPPVAPATPLPGQASAFTRARAYLALCDPAIAGQGGHNQTFKIACKLVKGFGLDAETALHLLLSDYNPRCEPPWTEKELRHKVNDAVRAPGETGTMLSASRNTNGVSRPVPELTREKPKPVAHARRYSTIERKRVEWLVPDWLPLGKVVVLDGDPGLGKSTLLLDIAARVTTHGMHFNNKQGPVGTVVLLSAEDGPEDTIKPRLEAAGANPEMIIDLSDITVGDKQRPPEIPLDLDLIESVIKEHKAKLLIIEPLAAFLAGPDANKDQEIRRVLYKLSKIAERNNCTIIVLRHLNKSGGGKAIYRGNMSIGVIGHARIGLLVAEDPDDEKYRVLAMAKINCGPKQGSVRFALEPVGDVCRINWCGQSSYNADQLLSQPSDAARQRTEDAETKVEQARALLEMLLAASNGIIPIKETRQELANAGIGQSNSDRAVNQLGMTVQYDVNPDGKRVYFWVAPSPSWANGVGE